MTIEGDSGMQPREFYGWKFLAVLWLILFVNFAFPIYGSGVISGYMVAALHFDRRTLGIIFAVFYWMHGIPGLWLPFVLTRKARGSHSYWAVRSSAWGLSPWRCWFSTVCRSPSSSV